MRSGIGGNHAHFVGGLALVVASLVGAAPAEAGKPVCGDGVVNGKELCDGAALNGMTCLGLGFAGGTLACKPDCTFDSSGCTNGGASCGDGQLGGHEECDGVADAACPGVCSAHCACPATVPGDLEVHLIDVGQGDAILVISPDGFVMLVDSGTASMAAIVENYMAALGIFELDYTLVSHMHADHLGGMDPMLDMHPEVVSCFDHGGAYASMEYDQYDSVAAERRTTVSAGSEIDLGPSMSVAVLHAFAGDSNENNNSVVIKLTYGDNTIVLGGDCESSCESSFDPGSVQIYKVHHHGSATGSGDALLDVMDAYTALIPVGINNAYGHPDPETLKRLADHQVVVYRTDLDGSIAVVSNGVSYTVDGLPMCQSPQTRSCGLSDVGACKYGVRPCVDGLWGVCEGAVYPVDEICGNGLDDDCDGQDDAVDPDCAAPSGHLVISQVGYDTPGDDALEEFVDLYNPTSGPVSLDGWSLADAVSTWYLPANTTVQPKAFLSIARNTAGFQALYRRAPDVSGMTLSLNNTAERLTLASPAGVVDFVAWEDATLGWPIAAPTGSSIERADPTVDTDSVQDFLVTTPAVPRGGIVSLCGNSLCDAGEDCHTCPGDCPGKTGGKPSSLYCCGNGNCEPWGESVSNCPLDCL